MNYIVGSSHMQTYEFYKWLKVVHIMDFRVAFKDCLLQLLRNELTTVILSGSIHKFWPYSEKFYNGSVIIPSITNNDTFMHLPQPSLNPAVKNRPSAYLMREDWNLVSSPFSRGRLCEKMPYRCSSVKVTTILDRAVLEPWISSRRCDLIWTWQYQVITCGDGRTSIDSNWGQSTTMKV